MTTGRRPGLVLNGILTTPSLLEAYSVPFSHAFAYGTVRFASSIIARSIPAVPVFANARNWPLRISARLLLPLPIKSMTYTPGFVNSGNANERANRRNGGSAYGVTFSEFATKPSRLMSVSISFSVVR